MSTGIQAFEHEYEHAFALRSAMRHAAGGVSVITAGIGSDRTGLTVTSATSLSMEPPTMLICVNRSASAWPVIRKHGHFAVSILSATQQHVAERFAGYGGVKGEARYEGAAWRGLPSGASGLENALAVVDCAVDEIIERHSHGIILGSVVSVTLGSGPSRVPLIYAHGRFTQVGPPASSAVPEQVVDLPVELPDGASAAHPSPSDKSPPSAMKQSRSGLFFKNL